MEIQDKIFFGEEVRDFLKTNLIQVSLEVARANYRKVGMSGSRPNRITAPARIQNISDVHQRIDLRLREIERVKRTGG